MTRVTWLTWGWLWWVGWLLRLGWLGGLGWLEWLGWLGLLGWLGWLWWLWWLEWLWCMNDFDVLKWLGYKLGWLGWLEWLGWLRWPRWLGWLQWGTKVLRHFRKMAPFWIVDLPIPFPCLPPSLPPKINVVFWTLKSFFYFWQQWFEGWGDLWCLKGMK